MSEAADIPAGPVSRRDGGTIATSLHASGTIKLDPPGLSITVDELYPHP